MSTCAICEATTAAHLATIRELFGEYAAWLGVNLTFQGFPGELQSLPGAYAPPLGRLLLAMDGETPLGCVALRPLSGDVCEMKRLYVRPQHQQRGIGRALAARVIAEARAVGYTRMVLDTLPRMAGALRLYESLGFTRRSAYYETPLAETVFLELTLLGESSGRDAAAVVIRELRSDDPIPEITALLHDAYAPLAAMGFRYLATHQDDDTTRERLAAGTSFVAVWNGAIVSTITLRPTKTESDCSWYCRAGVFSFGQFAVRPDLQRKGIGNRLLSTVEQRALDLGAHELALDTAEGATHLRRWYERLGFRLVGHVSWHDTNYRSVVLSKTLRPPADGIAIAAEDAAASP